MRRRTKPRRIENFWIAFRHALQSDLSSSGKYRIVPSGCGARPCTSAPALAELQEAAEAAGARLVVTGGIHKMSTLVQWAKIQIADADQGRIVFDRLLTFRGDSAAAWQRAEAFLARDILAASPGFDKAPARRASTSRSSISSSSVPGLAFAALRIKLPPVLGDKADADEMDGERFAMNSVSIQYFIERTLRGRG